MELFFASVWRRALGLETILLVIATIWAIVMEQVPRYPLVLIIAVSYALLLMGWMKYWHMERALGVPFIF